MLINSGHDLVEGVGFRRVLVTHVVAVEPTITEGLERRAQALAAVEQVILRPQVDQAVRGRGAGEADHPAELRQDFAQRAEPGRRPGDRAVCAEPPRLDCPPAREGNEQKERSFCGR